LRMGIGYPSSKIAYDVIQWYWLHLLVANF